MSASTATTKERILDAAEELMLTKSFHSVGLNEILSAVKVPKGSFYHYFESKEQFGVELIRHHVTEATASKRRVLLNQDIEPNPLERLLSYLNGCVAKLMESECRCGCLVLKLATEVSAMSDDMRAVLADGMKDWRAIFEKVIREGQAKKGMRTDLDPVATAAMINDYWTGALQRMVVERTVAPLKSAVAFLSRYLAA
jgi:TetR/AcrR family transcriptional repressor of nem operon